MTDYTPESFELLVEGVRRASADLSEYELDEQLAIAIARRDAAAAHSRADTAAGWQEVALALDDVRAARIEVASEIDRLTAPPATNGTMEPPC